MTSSPPPAGADAAPPSDVESQLSSPVHDLTQNVQIFSMDNMIKIINEIDQNSTGITDEIKKSKDSVLFRKIHLEEEKDHFQKAAFTVLDMFNSRNVS